MQNSNKMKTVFQHNYLSILKIKTLDVKIGYNGFAFSYWWHSKLTV